MDRFATDPKVYAAAVKQSTSPGEYNLDKSKYTYCLDTKEVTSPCTEVPLVDLETCSQVVVPRVSNCKCKNCKCKDCKC